MQWALFAGVPDDHITELLSTARPRRFRSGEVIFHEEDPADSFHLVRSGRVVVRVTTADGHVLTINVLGAGDAFGELALLGAERRRSATVAAIAPTETFEVRAVAFESLTAAQPKIDRTLAVMYANRVRQLSAALAEALHVPAETRVIRRLTQMSVIFADGERPPVVHLTQEDLASLAGTSRVTVNRVLRRCEAADYVVLDRGRITINDLAGLRDLAE